MEFISQHNRRSHRRSVTCQRDEPQTLKSEVQHTEGVAGPEWEDASGVKLFREEGDDSS